MTQNPLRGNPDEHGRLIRHQVLPPSSCTMFDVPRRARVTAETYGGETVSIVADVVARSGEWLCIAQPDGDGIWNAWVHKNACTPL